MFVQKGATKTTVHVWRESASVERAEGGQASPEDIGAQSTPGQQNLRRVANQVHDRAEELEAASKFVVPQDETEIVLYVALGPAEKLISQGGRATMRALLRRMDDQGSRIDALLAKDKIKVYTRGGSGGDDLILLSKRKFGHTFAVHGQEKTVYLRTRAAMQGKPNGQWTDDQTSAQFLMDNMHLAKNGPVTIPLPEGFPARLVHGDGTFSAATRVTLIPSKTGLKTAFPEP